MNQINANLFTDRVGVGYSGSALLQYSDHLLGFVGFRTGRRLANPALNERTKRQTLQIKELQKKIKDMEK